MNESSATSRISRIKLEQIELRLTEKDRQIFSMLNRLRYLKTNQIQRLFFDDQSHTKRAMLSATMRTLNRLERYGLITHLTRQFSGFNHGSSGKVWHMTEAGLRLLAFGRDMENKRTRTMEPSQTFLRHTLAVSECFVQIAEICRSDNTLSIKTLDTEPIGWRAYKKDEKDYSLRPDLYAEIVNGKYEDRWFIEMDLDTESTTDIAEKCRRYQHYCQAGVEQKATGVFPLVLWIVPTEDRRQKMIEAIRLSFGNRYPHMHYVITPEMLNTTIKDGAKESDLC